MTKDKPATSLSDIAIETIRDRILDMTLKPGMQLDESILREQLSINRTPAREALNRLTAEGLVEKRSNKGFYVTSLDVHKTARFFEAFFLVELAAANLCRFTHPNLADDLDAIQCLHGAAVDANEFLKISRYNADFHIRIVLATENDHLLDFAQRIHNYARRLVYFNYSTESDDEEYFSGQQNKIKDEHVVIIDAIRRHDRKTLVDTMSHHANRFQIRMLRFLGGRWPSTADASDIITSSMAMVEAASNGIKPGRD